MYKILLTLLFFFYPVELSALLNKQVDSPTDCGVIAGQVTQLCSNATFRPSIAIQGEQYTHITWDIDIPPGTIRIPYTRSTDSGKTFEEVRDLANGDTSLPIVGLRRVLANDRYVFIFAYLGYEYAVSSDPKPIWMFRSSDHGLTWEAPRKINPVTDLARNIETIDCWDDTIMIIYTPTLPMENYSRRSILYSSNSGNTWQSRQNYIYISRAGSVNNLKVTSNVSHLTYLIAPGWDPRWYRHRNIYLRSSNLGRSWQRGVLPKIVRDIWGGLFVIAASPPRHLYIAAVLNNNVFFWRSTNDGRRWYSQIKLNEVPTASDFAKITVDKYSASNIAIVWSEFFEGSGYKLMASISRDYGVTWCSPVSITPFLDKNPSLYLTSIVLSQTRLSAVWTNWGGMSGINIFTSSASFVPSTSMITERFDLEQTDAELEGIQLYQNYPNPFNTSTTIEFSLLEATFVTIKVYNVIGQEVATIVENEYFPEGFNELIFDAGNLSSGVYYYKLFSGQYVQTKKLLIIK